MYDQRLLWLSLLLFFSVYAFAQPISEWEFKKERDGIKVFTRDVANSNIKELRITLEVNATMSSIVALLADINKYQDWVYKCSLSKNLEKIDENRTYDYYIADFPWPISDRDLVAYSYITQDPITKVLESITEARPDYIPQTEGNVRVLKHLNRWRFTPIGPNLIAVEYTLQSDPAGSIPSWIVNMAIDQGPVQSMLRFRKMLRNHPYKDAKLAGILEF